MPTDTGYERGNYLRVCDICGHRFHFRDLKPIGELRFACPDDAPGLTAVQISRYNARARPLVVRPNKWAKDWVTTPIYQLAEAQIFNFIAATAPAGETGGSSDALAAAWAAIYLADVVLDARRPMIWDRKARTVLTTCLDYLMGLQSLDSKAHGGGIVYGGVCDTRVTIATGVALMKGYSITGSPTYLAAAERAATYIRNTQCGDVSIGFTVVPGSLTPYHSGGLHKTMEVTDDAFMHRDQMVRDIGALWFLKLLQDVRGPEAIYGGDVGWNASTAAPLSTMISELVGFAVNGAVVTGGSLQVGLAPSLPRVKYQSAQSGGSASASWEVPAGVSVADICLALRGLDEASQEAALVTSMVDFLAACPSTAANETPSTNNPEQTFVDMTGTYDAALCPATLIDEVAPFGNDSRLYDWASLGLLSGILSASSAGQFRTSKDTVSTAQRYTTLDVTTKFLGPEALSGLSLQPLRVTTSGRYDTSVVRAARLGLAYRENPQRYPDLRGN